MVLYPIFCPYSDILHRWSVHYMVIYPMFYFVYLDIFHRWLGIYMVLYPIFCLYCIPISAFRVSLEISPENTYPWLSHS